MTMTRWKLSSGLILAGMLLASAGFAWLGIWQLQRLQWKLALIERVNSRIQAPPVAPPAPEAWPTLTAAAAEYLRVTLSGEYLPDHEIKVHAGTALGTGYWVLTPLRTAAGGLVYINRGFVGMQHAPEVMPPATGAQQITGLLRISEASGTWLRKNHPEAANWQSRWYSRDIAAIARAESLTNVAPYFIDAEATTNTTDAPIDLREPRAGLTVVSFRNNHLSYALTWFALALLPWLLLWITIRRSQSAGREPPVDE